MINACHFRPRVLSLCVSLALFEFSPAQAACIPTGTPGNDTITCTGLDLEGVTGAGGNDTVNINTGAEVWRDDATSGVFYSQTITGIDMGTGNDTVTNRGSLMLVPRADAGLLMVLISPAKADLTGNGIVMGDGTNTADNYSLIEVKPESTSFSASIGILTGSALGPAFGYSHSTTTALGMMGGNGADTLKNHNTGSTNMTVKADATADTGEVSWSSTGFSFTLDTIWDAGTRSEANATGMSDSGGGSTLANEGMMDVTANATTHALRLTGVNQGLAVSITTSESIANAKGLLGSDAVDTLTNSGSLTVISDAWTGALSVGGLTASKNATGVVKNASGVKANASSIGFEGGGGNDSLTNSGPLTLSATANAYGISGSWTPETNNPDWVGWVKNLADPILDAGLNFLFDFESGTKATATATGISGGDGADTIDNSAAMEIDASSFAFQLGIEVDAGKLNKDLWKDVGAALVGVLAKGGKLLLEGDSGSAPTTSAWGMQGGDGADIITNSGSIRLDAASSASSTSVKLSNEGIDLDFLVSIFGSGTSVAAEAFGITGDAGADTLTNTGKVDAGASAKANNNGVSGAFKGVAQTVVSSDAKATTIGLDGGDDGDTLNNGGEIIAGADAVSVSVGLVATNQGVAIASDTLFNGGTQATATATGIAGGKGADTITHSTIVLGESTSAYPNRIDVDADANTNSDKGTFSMKGVAGAAATATSTATATGIDGGADNDTITSGSEVLVDAESDTVSVSVALSGQGVSLALDAVWEGGSKSSATALGIIAGDGTDSVTSKARIDVTADALVNSDTVSGNYQGVAAAAVTSTATAFAAGIDGGGNPDVVDAAGNPVMETLTSEGEVWVDAKTRTVSVGVSISGEGVALALDAVWDGGSKSGADAVGLSGGSGADTVTSRARIDVSSDAFVNSDTIAGNFMGVAGAVVSSTATADAIGIQGDCELKGGSVCTGPDDDWAIVSGDGEVVGAGGNDRIDNFNRIDADAKSEAVSVGVAISGTGLALAADAVWDGGTKATSTAVGMDGGIEHDVLTNYDTINVGRDFDVDAKARSNGISVAGLNPGTYLLGVAVATVTSTAHATFTGMDGGEGNDTLINAWTTKTIDGNEVVIPANIKVEATADAGSTGVSVTGTGIAAALDAIWDGGTKGIADGFGMAGGNGNDTVRNFGKVDVSTAALSRSTNVAVTLAGITGASSATTATASATSLDGGGGVDTLDNAGELIAKSDAYARSDSWSVSLVGFAGSWDGGTKAEAIAWGMSGGGGAGTLTNKASASITSTALASAKSTSVSGNLAGVPLAFAGGTANARPTGMAGGADKDTITNDGSIAVKANSRIDASSLSLSLVGVNFSKVTQSTAEVLAIGIDGGAEADTLTNTGTISLGLADTARPMAEAMAWSASWNLVDAAFSDAVVSAIAKSKGMAGGDGDDTLINTGTITAGPDLSGPVMAYADVSGSSWTLIGDTGADATAEVTAESTGLAGGAGANTLTNDGTITVRASSGLLSDRGAQSIFGSSETHATITATATATGIEGGEGKDDIRNFKTLEVHAVSDTEARNDSKSGILFGDTNTESKANATVTGYGVSALEGDNIVRNHGDLSVSVNNVGYAWGYASGAHVSFDGDGQTLAESHADANATGILAGDGNNTITNYKSISVLALATTVKNLTKTQNVCSQKEVTETVCHTETDEDGNSFEVCEEVPTGDIETTCEDETIVLDSSPTYAGANGNGIAGTGNATATGESMAEAYGIRVGDGENHIYNYQDITVTAKPEAKATVFADGDLAGDAIGNATVKSTAKAVGIWAGNGNNEIANNGTITVLAAPSAQARTEVTGGDICIWYLFGTWCGGGGDGIGKATATYDSLAIGIRAGDGNNTIVNNGTISVTAAPEAQDFSAKVFSANSSTLKTSVTSKAVGIMAGNGNNTIVNTGAIEVEARDLPIGYSCSSPPCVEKIEVIGIQTGDGNDVVSNSGILTTTVKGSLGAGMAITTGGGNDQVTLDEGSTTAGSIDLGGGDDSLTLVNDPAVTTSAVNGGAGFNTLVLEGSGSVGFDSVAIQALVKQGEGEYSLVHPMPGLTQVTLRGGSVLSSHAFSLAGEFNTQVNGDGSNGMLQAASVALGGNLTVAKGPGRFLDGTAYDFIQADGGLSGDFAGSALPASTPLLNFSLNRTVDAFQVLAHAASYASVADNRVGMTMGHYLDAIAPVASGDLADVLGELQGMTEPSALAEALISLSPESYDGLTRAASAVMGTQTAQLLSRLGALSEGSLSARAPSGFAPLRLAYGGDSHTLASLFDAAGRQPGKHGLWLEAFGQWGDQEDDAAGFTGFDYRQAGITLGYDRELSNDWIVGAALGYSKADLDFNAARTTGDIVGRYLSFYGGWNRDGAYAQGVISYGLNNYDQRRWVNVGGIDRIAVSDHEGNVLAVSLSGGLMSRSGKWNRGPYATLHYAHINEESFRETGAGGVDIFVGSKDTSALTSELGYRAAHSLKWRNGDLVTELHAAWSHDYDIDDRTITAGYAGAPGTSFSLQGQDAKSNGAILGAGLSYLTQKGMTAALRYQGEVREDFVSHAIFGELRISF